MIESMPIRERVLVDRDALRIERVRIGGLPIVNAVLARLGFDSLLEEYLDEPDPRCALAPVRVIGTLVRNLCLGRQPLYAVKAWASEHDPALFGLVPAEAAMINDDRVGRALDELFTVDRASMCTALSLATIDRFAIALDELHDDSTSLALYGAYANATGESRAGRTPPRPARGHSKDHLPDLLQLVWLLTISADGAVPITYRMMDGNTEDSTTHIATWDRCVRIAGTPSFLYVADSKLATRDNMGHIAEHGGRFLTIMPRTRKEDGIGRAFIASGALEWTEVSRRTGRRLGDPDEVYSAVPAPSCSAEGFRIVWFRSSTKRTHDASTRLARIEQAHAGLRELATSLRSVRCRLKNIEAVEDAAQRVLNAAHAARWVQFSVTDEVTLDYRQEHRGRPGKDTRYKKVESHRFSLDFSTNAEAVSFDAASDGCFPMVSNDTEMTAAEMLAAYKRQPRLERRHATFKGVIEAAPIELKSEYRIDAFGFCLYVALLVHALIERELRHAMADAGVTELPLYPEERACKAPTATRILELLGSLERTVICHDDEILAVVPPEPDPLQVRLLSLLKVPLSAYGML